MSYSVKLSSCASAMVLALALSQTGFATEGSGGAASPMPAAPAPEAAMPPAQVVPGAPGVSADADEQHAQPKSNARWEEHRGELNQRYADLRKRAEEAGMRLPEMPPWERMPHGDMPMGPPMSEEDMNAMQAMHERMMNMTPEERETMREEHYQKMRERAKTKGVDLPETPPWKQAQQAQKSSAEQRARYQEIMAAMSDEQREACHAMHYRPWRVPPMPPQMGPGYDWGYGRPYGHGPGPDYPRWPQPWLGYPGYQDQD